MLNFKKRAEQKAYLEGYLQKAREDFIEENRMLKEWIKESFNALQQPELQKEVAFRRPEGKTWADYAWEEVEKSHH